VDERRIFDRVPASFFSEITCSETGRLVGHLADISLSGMMIIGAEELTSGEKMRVQVEMPRSADLPPRIEVAVTVCWSRPDVDPGTWVSGFEFMSGTDTAAHNVALLVRTLSVMS